VNNLCAGSYTVTITDANNCQKDTMVTVPSPPAVLGATTSQPSNCNQSDGSVNVTGSGGTDPSGIYSYLWSLAGATSATVSNVAAGTYTVTVTDNNSCTGTTTVQVLTIGGVSVKVQSSSPISCFAACTGTATAQAVGGTAPFVFSWTGTGGPYSGDSLVNLCQGNYSVTITDSKGCRATIVDTVKIPTFPTPVAAFSTNPTTASTYDPTFTFTDQSKGASVWLWNFGDTAAPHPRNDTLENPSHTYPAVASSFCVQLIVANIQGCVDSITHCISIGPEFEFYVPDAFTPNGDSKNDIFYGYGIGIIQYQMLVFDRWGNLIFTSHDLYTGWNGKANGGEKIAQQDVYVYKIDLTDVFNKPHSYVGHITLLK
jgi:gliding motility-associated-like protein